MASEQDSRREVPAYVALVRIGAVISMSTATAFGIILLLLGADYLIWGLLSIAAAVPCFAIMRLVERTAEPPQPQPPAA